MTPERLAQIRELVKAWGMYIDNRTIYDQVQRATTELLAEIDRLTLLQCPDPLTHPGGWLLLGDDAPQEHDDDDGDKARQDDPANRKDHRHD